MLWSMYYHTHCDTRCHYLSLNNEFSGYFGKNHFCIKIMQQLIFHTFRVTALELISIVVEKAYFSLKVSSLSTSTLRGEAAEIKHTQAGL